MTKKISCVNVQFDHIHTNVITSSSGIFVGNNQALYWRSLSKNNLGVGSGSDNRIERCTNIIFDNDVIDSPMTENTTFTDEQKPSEINQVQIQFETINTNSINSTSSISLGENDQRAWSGHTKFNNGSGSFYGNTMASDNQNYIVDDDMIDSPITVTKSFQPKEQSQDEAADD